MEHNVHLVMSHHGYLVTGHFEKEQIADRLTHIIIPLAVNLLTRSHQLVKCTEKF